MSIYLIERTIDAYDELSMNPQNTIYYRVMNERNIGDLCEQLTLKQKCEGKLEELLDLEYESIEHIQFIHITKENMYGILNDLKEHEKEELFSALLDEIDW